MLDNKVVVVVGGAGLLGKAFSMGLADKGAQVVVADISKEAAESVASEIQSQGLSSRALHIDITDTRSVDFAISQVDQWFGRIDAVVNNAYPRNSNYGAILEEVAYEDFCENLNLHLGGYFLICQRFSRYFSQTGGGNIVNLASIYGVMPPRFEVYEGTAMTMPVEYAAIKSGIIQLTGYFAKYYKNKGIKVNTLSPGGILDNQDKQFQSQYNKHCLTKGMLDPGDIVGTLAFLLSDLSTYVNGQNIIVDDGFSL